MINFHTARLLGFVLGVSLLISPARADLVKTDDYVGLVRSLTKQVALPAHRQFAIEGSLLGETLNGFCAVPTEEGRRHVYTRFHAMMDAWQMIEPFRFGPVMEAPGPSRFQFWPDKRQTGQRQLRQLLASEDKSILDKATLGTKSIALRDLQALEAVLFDDPDAILIPGSFRCAYATIIADHQRTEAAKIYDAWVKPDGFAHELMNAENGTASFFDEREAAGAYLNALVSTLEVIRLQKLDRPMGLTIEEARTTRLENWRSERSARNIIKNLETLKTLFTTRGGFSDLLVQATKQADAQETETLLNKMLTHLQDFEQPLEAMVEAPNARPALETLLTDLRTFQALIQDRIAIDLGLVRGFNATDGD